MIAPGGGEISRQPLDHNRPLWAPKFSGFGSGEMKDVIWWPLIYYWHQVRSLEEGGQRGAAGGLSASDNFQANRRASLANSLIYFSISLSLCVGGEM